MKKTPVYQPTPEQLLAKPTEPVATPTLPKKESRDMREDRGTRQMKTTHQSQTNHAQNKSSL
jgi:hypothetical protein